LLQNISRSLGPGRILWINDLSERNGVIKLKRMRLAGHVARMRDKSNAYRILVGKPEEKRPLGRPRRSWVDNIKTDFRETGWDDMDWIDLAQDRDRWKALVHSVINLRVP
jgi:hypothetical protein